MHKPHCISIGALLCASLCSLSLGGCSSDSAAGVRVSAEDAGPVALRRLTAEQYERSIHDVLGRHITVPSRLDPDDRREGLLAVGSSFAGITPSGFEKYEAAAATIAEQALDAEHRDDLVPCQPESASAADDACARAFVEQVGRRLLRRSPTGQETEARVQIAAAAAEALGGFYPGLELALASLLVSPDFLFRVEEAETDPSDPSRSRLTSVSVAPRLS